MRERKSNGALLYNDRSIAHAYTQTGRQADRPAGSRSGKILLGEVVRTMARFIGLHGYLLEYM